MVTRPKGKRYLLVEVGRLLTPKLKNELADVITEKHPTVTGNRLIWLDKHLIVKTDTSEIFALRETLRLLKVRRIVLRSISTSGSINKLKKLADGAAEARS
jgi:hypothetical protein